MADERIDVAFSVDIDMDRVSELKNKLGKLHQGTFDYCQVYDELKELHKQFLERLEGTCLAHMNIARDDLKRIVTEVSSPEG